MRNFFKSTPFWGITLFTISAIALVALTSDALFAQQVLGIMQRTIDNMVTVLNVLIVGILAWCGFLLARGDGSAVQRIIYLIIGLVVVNSAHYILNFFSPG